MNVRGGGRSVAPSSFVATWIEPHRPDGVGDGIGDAFPEGFLIRRISCDVR